MWRRSSTLLALVCSLSALMASAAVAYEPGDVTGSDRTPSPAPHVIDLLFAPLPEQAESTYVEPGDPVKAPLAPVAPVAPIAPLAPIAPIDAIQAIEGIAPIAPIAPVAPVAPLPPVDPAI
jgi:hypothetical protein